MYTFLWEASHNIINPLNSQKENSILQLEYANIEIDKGIVISPLIRNIENFESWLDVKPFYMNIVNERVVLVGK